MVSIKSLLLAILIFVVKGNSLAPLSEQNERSFQLLRLKNSARTALAQSQILITGKTESFSDRSYHISKATHKKTNTCGSNSLKKCNSMKSLIARLTMHYRKQLKKHSHHKKKKKLKKNLKVKLKILKLMEKLRKRKHRKNVLKDRKKILEQLQRIRSKIHRRDLKGKKFRAKVKKHLKNLFDKDKNKHHIWSLMKKILRKNKRAKMLERKLKMKSKGPKKVKAKKLNQVKTAPKEKN